METKKTLFLAASIAFVLVMIPVFLVLFWLPTNTPDRNDEHIIIKNGDHLTEYYFSLDVKNGGRQLEILEIDSADLQVPEIQEALQKVIQGNLPGNQGKSFLSERQGIWSHNATDLTTDKNQIFRELRPLVMAQTIFFAVLVYLFILILPEAAKNQEAAIAAEN